MATRSPDIPSYRAPHSPGGAVQNPNAAGRDDDCEASEKGWLVELPLTITRQRYRVTPASETAMRIKIPLSR